MSSGVIRSDASQPEPPFLATKTAVVSSVTPSKAHQRVPSESRKRRGWAARSPPPPIVSAEAQPEPYPFRVVHDLSRRL